MRNRIQIPISDENIRVGQTYSERAHPLCQAMESAGYTWPVLDDLGMTISVDEGKFKLAQDAQYFVDRFNDGYRCSPCVVHLYVLS